MSQAHYHMCPLSTCKCPHSRSKISPKPPLKWTDQKKPLGGTKAWQMWNMWGWLWLCWTKQWWRRWRQDPHGQIQGVWCRQAGHRGCWWVWRMWTWWAWFVWGWWQGGLVVSQLKRGGRRWGYWFLMWWGWRLCHLGPIWCERVVVWQTQCVGTIHSRWALLCWWWVRRHCGGLRVWSGVQWCCWWCIQVRMHHHCARGLP